MEADGGDILPDKPVELASLIIIRNNGLERIEDERMVGHDELRTEPARLGDDGVRDVQRRQHAMHLLRRVADEQPDVVKVEFRVKRRIFVEKIADLSYVCHVLTS